MKFKQITLLKTALAALMTCAMVGCGSGDMVGDAVNNANKTNIARIANVYGMFQMKTPGNPGPKDEAELKKFMQDNQEVVNAMGIEDFDAVFTSERDNAPIKVRWGVQGSSRGCYEPVAFETTGVDGVRMVGFCNGTQEEVEDDTTYENMFAGKYKPADTRGDESAIPKFDSNGKQIN